LPVLTKKALPGMFLDEKVPLDHRRQLLGELCQSGSKEANRILEAILKAAARGDGGEAAFEQKARELQEMLEALEQGPPRHATFVRLLTPNGTPLTRVHVKLDDGTSTYPVVARTELAEGLHRGDSVMVSARAEMLLARLEESDEIGETARLEDWMTDRVEVSLRSDERHVLHLGDELRRRLERGEVRIGQPLLVCLRRGMALDVVPRSVDELARFTFLSDEPVPDVLVERDVGDPPPIIEDITRVCRHEMLDPGRRRRYGLRRCLTVLFSGVSGSGKSLSIAAAIRRIYEVMAEVTGAPLDQLPPRIVRLRMSKLLSQWLGRSDKNADRLVDEIVELAGRTFEGPSGPVELPVIVVMEEFDGIARRRGLDHDGVYDRIQTTLLQRLDHTTNAALRDRLIFLFATTNVPDLIDPAWIRRVGGRIVRFGRLRRRGFAAVLDKHLGDRPLAGGGRSALVHDVTATLFGGDDPPVVELHLAGTTAPCTKRRRDFLTGSIVDRAMQQAAGEAFEREAAGTGAPGLDRAGLVAALCDQVDAVIRSLTPANAAEFVDLPEGARIISVRRLEQPLLAAADLQV